VAQLLTSPDLLLRTPCAPPPGSRCEQGRCAWSSRSATAAVGSL